MKYFIVAYLELTGNYNIKFTPANDNLSALCKTIPQFSLLKQNVESSFGSCDLDIINYNLDSIGLLSYDCIEVEDVSKPRYCVIAYYSPLTQRLHLYGKGDTTKLSILTSTFRTVVDFTTTECQAYIEARDYRGLVNHVNYNSDYRIYDVSTLKQLIKRSIPR